MSHNRSPDDQSRSSRADRTERRKKGFEARPSAPPAPLSCHDLAVATFMVVFRPDLTMNRDQKEDASTSNGGAIRSRGPVSVHRAEPLPCKGSRRWGAPLSAAPDITSPLTRPNREIRHITARGYSPPVRSGRALIQGLARPKGLGHDPYA